MEDYVNPEPPAEINKFKEDLIGNTLFSKHWLCELLLKIIKKVEESEQERLEVDEDSEPEPVSNFKELDSDFEKELCELWDMSVEYEVNFDLSFLLPSFIIKISKTIKKVCKELDILNSIQIFQGFIFKHNTVYPRAIEILLGILVNMISLSDEINLKLVRNSELIQFIVYECFSPMLDVQVVTQCVRMFSLFLVSSSSENNQSVRRLFIEYLKQESLHYEDKENNEIITNWQGMIEKFYFILEQSLNPVLLDSAVLFLFNLLDYDDETLNYLTINDRLLETLCTASNTRMNLENKKTGSTQFTSVTNHTTDQQKNLSDQTPLLLHQTSQDDICHTDELLNKYFMCLHTITTNEQGVLAFYSKFPSVLGFFNEYLNKCLTTLNEWEIRSAGSLKTSVSEESLQNFSCLLSVLNCVFSNHASFPHLEHLLTDFFIRLFTYCQSYLKLFNELKKLDESDSLTSVNLDLAKTSLKDLVSNLQSFISKYNNKHLIKLIENCNKLLQNK